MLWFQFDLTREISYNVYYILWYSIMCTNSVWWFVQSSFNDIWSHLIWKLELFNVMGVLGCVVARCSTSFCTRSFNFVGKMAFRNWNKPSVLWWNYIKLIPEYGNLLRLVWEDILQIYLLIRNLRWDSKRRKWLDSRDSS